MQSLVNFFAERNLDIWLFLKASGILAAALLAVALAGRFIGGKRSIQTRAVSSTIGILFIYGVTIVLSHTGKDFHHFLAPLPFVNIENDYMILYSFQAHYTEVCTQVLSMTILSFLMNLAESCLPTGKNFFVWVLLRCFAVVGGMILHLAAISLLATYVPEGLMTYAPMVLLAVLVLLLLTGSLKVVVGLFLLPVNPVIAALYTFFFANIIGRQITKAVLTAGILTGITLGLQRMGIHRLYIAPAAWEAYIPLLLLLVALWYVVGRLLSSKK